VKTDSGLYDVLEKILRKSRNPMTCGDLFDVPEVREFAKSPNRVSDYLGGLWRKGLVSRLPAPKDGSSAARWAYAWKPKAATHQASTVTPIDYPGPRKGPIFSRPSIEITEEGKNIVIDLPSLRITIQTKD
jgi:hypothetical protein